MTNRALVILVVALALGPRTAAAQGAAGEPAVALHADCPTAVPDDLSAALELELQERVVVGGDAEVMVRVTTSCERAGRDLDIVVETSAGTQLGPLHLDVIELGARIRGRMAALWVAEHVRVARGDVEAAVGVVDTVDATARPVPTTATGARVEPATALRAPATAAASAPPAPEDAAPERARLLVRGDLALAFHHDVVAGGVGPGGDLRIELGTRGRPGVALELGVGGTGLTRNVEDQWTELRASVGGVLDVVLDPVWGAAFGARVLFVHEVLTGNRRDASSTSSYRIDDPLDIRATAFAAGRLYVHQGLSVFAEVELGVLLVSFVPSATAAEREQNLVQGVLRVGLGID